MKKLALASLYLLLLVFVSKEGLLKINEVKAIYIDAIIPDEELFDIATYCFLMNEESTVRNETTS